MLRFGAILSFIFIAFGLAAQQSVTVLFTNNTNGISEICDCGTDPLGGLARRKFLFDSLLRKDPQIVKLDAGDFLDAFGFNPKKDALVLSLYKSLDYDAINVGDQEFANGTEFARQNLVQAGLALVSATLAGPPNHFSIPPSVVLTKRGLRIGVIGYMPWSSFMYFPAKTSLAVRDFGDGLDILLKSVNALRPQVDLLVVLSQAGFERDMEWVSKVPGVDLVVGGHSQTELLEPQQVGKTLIVQAGGGGTHVGQLVIDKDKSKWKVRDYQLIALDSHIPEDSSFHQKIDRFEKERTKK